MTIFFRSVRPMLILVSICLNANPPPTSLSVTSLWLKPWDAARFLKSLLSFDFFPDIGQPPPRPRRRRRPPPRLPDTTADLFSPLSLPPSPFLFTPHSSVPPPLMSLLLGAPCSSSVPDSFLLHHRTLLRRDLKPLATWGLTIVEMIRTHPRIASLESKQTNKQNSNWSIMT